MSKIIILIALVLPLAMIQPAMAKSSNSNNSSNHSRITICHATGSESNPYVKITINKNGWLNGHEEHQDERDFIVTGERECPSKNEEHEKNPSTPETPTPTPEITKVIAPQIAAASISPTPEAAAATSLPRGGGNSNLVTSLMIGFGLLLASALISQTAKKLKLV